MEKNKPQIRFKGFTEDWFAIDFDNVFNSVSNNSLSRDMLNYQSGNAKNIHYGDILVKFNEIVDVEKEVIPYVSDNETVEKLKTSKLLDGDIIISDAAEDETVGKCIEIINVKDNVVLSGLHTIAVRPKQKFAPKYLGYYMNSNSYHDQLLKLMQGTKVLSISKSSIKKTLINYPNNDKEQQKIGTFFENIDKLITEHQQKHSKLKALKKAMLSKMFPQQGQTVPEIRFKGFTGDWEEKKMEEIGKATSGTSIESEFNKNGKFKVISIGSYSENSTYTDQGLRANFSEKTQSRILNLNDLTMVLNDKTTSGNILGRVLLINQDKEFVYNQRTQRIEPYINDFYPIFLYHFLNAPNIRNKILKICQGNTQIYVNWSAVRELKYFIPSKNEQKVIGDYFENIEKLITNHELQINKLQSIKKAFLAKMFI